MIDDVDTTMDIHISDLPVDSTDHSYTERYMYRHCPFMFTLPMEGCPYFTYGTYSQLVNQNTTYMYVCMYVWKLLIICSPSKYSFEIRCYF